MPAQIIRGAAAIAAKLAASKAARAAGKKVVSSVQGKKAGQNYATSAAKKAAELKKAQAKAVAELKNARASTKGLKAAQGKSLAPKGYVPDTVGRAAVKEFSTRGIYHKVMGEYVKLTPKEAASVVSKLRSTSAKPSFEGAIKMTRNVVSKSGRKANTPKLMKKAAKKAK